MNHAKPVSKRNVANELLNEAFADLNAAVIPWYTIQSKAICHRLLKTAHPNACRKLVEPVIVGFIF